MDLLEENCQRNKENNISHVKIITAQVLIVSHGVV